MVEEIESTDAKGHKKKIVKKRIVKKVEEELEEVIANCKKSFILLLHFSFHKVIIVYNMC